jgi:2Fe-2S ferredoxin
MKEIKVNFVLTDGTIETIEVPTYNTLMEATKYYSKNGYIETIDAECGGACACATCHVIVDDKWIDKVGKQPEGSAEQALLDYEHKANDNSRLSCQIILDESMDGLTVHIPYDK